MNGLVRFVMMAAVLALPLSGAWAQQQPPPQPGQPQSSEPPARSEPVQQQPQGPPQPTGQATPDRQAGQDGLMVASDSLLGTKVRDAEGKDIGEVSKLLIDAKDGKVTSAIIKQGGTLGMGGKEISVPWDALTLQRGDNQDLVITMHKPMLEQAPSAREQRQRERQAEQSPAASPGPSGQEQRQPEPQRRQ